jgi:hypothetical protein
MGYGDLPRAADRQASWALAWWPGPAEEVARGVGTGRARRRLDGGWSAERFDRGAPGGSPERTGGKRGWWAHRGDSSMGGGGAEAVRRCSRMVEALRRSVGVGSSSCNTVHRGGEG